MPIPNSTRDQDLLATGQIAPGLLLLLVHSYLNPIGAIRAE